MDAPTEHSIWKFPLYHDGKVAMPKGSIPRHVNVQDGRAYIWAEVFPTNQIVKRVFKVYGTGHKMDPPVEGEEYLGTFMLDWMVFHVYDTKQEIW